MPIRRLLDLFAADDPGKERNPFAAALADHLQRFPTERLEYLASFAGQLARVAYADDEISDPEIATISRLLVEQGGLLPTETRVVVDLLKVQLDALRGFEEYRLNRGINEHTTIAERERLVDCLFAVAAADDLISNVEDQEIRRIGHALELPIERFMDIRSRYRDRLEVLREAAAARRDGPAPSSDD